MVAQVTDSTFHQTINSGVYLVDFYADWCGPCKMLSPVLEEISNETADFVICKIDTDANQKIAQQFQITSLPTLILFKDGKEAARILGLRDKATILAFVEQFS